MGRGIPSRFADALPLPWLNDPKYKKPRSAPNFQRSAR
jgi:hypothetical protein